MSLSRCPCCLRIPQAVYLVAATNRPDMIDPALLRPGRLDKILYVPLPTADGRLGILQTLARKTPLAPGVDLGRVAEIAHGFSGADMAALVREACINAMREGLTGEAMTDDDNEKGAEDALCSAATPPLLTSTASLLTL